MKKIIVIFMMISCCLTACHKTPTTTVINNHNDISNDIISEQTTLEPEENMIHIEISEEEIKETITCGNVTVSIEGMLYYPDRVDGLYEYLASETDYSEYEKNMMFLFGEYEDEAHVHELTRHIVANLGGRCTATIVNSRKYDVDNFTGQMGYISFFIDDIPVTEAERKVNMTFEDAINEADGILERIGINNFVFWDCKYNKEVLLTDIYGEDACYYGDTISVVYYQQLQGVPVRTMLYGKYLAPGLGVAFDSKGVNAVSIREYKYDRIGRIEQCLTYEEALNVFSDYISKNEEYDSITFTEISFEYGMVKSGKKGEFAVIPLWVFRTEDTHYELRDICINAQSGEIENLIAAWN